MLGNVLIIDDEASLRSTLARILQNAGCSVTSAADGAEALRLLSTNMFDLVYLDLRLPDMHGLEILREMRKIFPKLPVVMLTAYGSMNSAVEAMHLEATDYLLKPIDPEILIARTRMVLRKQWTEKRRMEIQNQIAALQTELAKLDQQTTIPLVPSASLNQPDSRFIRVGPFIIDLQSRRAMMGNNQLDLPPASFEYLVVLARHAPDIVRYQTLVTEAQGYLAESSEARDLTKWHIHILRQAIETDPRAPQLLLNVRGVGYQLVVD